MRAQEREALELLTRLDRWVWDGTSLPLPVEEIAETHFGLRVRDAEPAAIAAVTGGEVVSGLLLVGAKEIWVNAEETQASPGRRRFTIGHEIGHWVLHRDAAERDGLFCRGAQIRLDEAAPDIEEEATVFAGGLLFPDALVRLEWDRLGDLTALQERFAGSRVATERALFRAVRAPAVRDRLDGGVEGFYWDDDAYVAWLERHRARGWVVSDRLDDPALGRLHTAGCSYLWREPTPGHPRTRAPKWCALDAAALRRAVPEARPCSRCG